MDKSLRMRWAGHVARVASLEVHTVFWYEQKGRRPVGRPRRRWEGNIKMYIRQVGWEYMDRNDLADCRDKRGLL